MPCSIYQRESTNAQKASDISMKTTFYVVDSFVCKKVSESTPFLFLPLLCGFSFFE